jgi:hypothetical protein
VSTARSRTGSAGPPLSLRGPLRTRRTCNYRREELGY